MAGGVNIVCRQATVADAAKLASLLAELMLHYQVRPPAPTVLMSVVIGALESDSQTFLLAETPEGEAIGACEMLLIWDPWVGARACELRDLIVVADRRGKGVGRVLVGEAAALAQARGCTRIFVLTDAWNREGTALYRRLGFSEKDALYFERTVQETVG